MGDGLEGHAPCPQRDQLGPSPWHSGQLLPASSLPCPASLPPLRQSHFSVSCSHGNPHLSATSREPNLREGVKYQCPKKNQLCLLFIVFITVNNALVTGGEPLVTSCAHLRLCASVCSVSSDGNPLATLTQQIPVCSFRAIGSITSSLQPPWLWVVCQSCACQYHFLTEVQLIYNVLLFIVQQNGSAIYVHICFFIFFSIMVYYCLLNTVPCAVQYVLVVYFIYSSLYLLVPDS